MMTESEIAERVEQVKSGDTAAFSILYQETRQRVYVICLHFLRQATDAEDLMQDTYLTAYKRIHELREPERFRPWLERIAANSCRDYLKKKRPELMEQEVLQEIQEETQENFLPEEYCMNQEKRRIILDIMRRQLSNVQYETVVLYYYSNLSIDEIADIMDCPSGTVKYRLSDARGRIKKGVEAYENRIHDKLYSFAGVPFLALLLSEDAKSYPVPDIEARLMDKIYSRNQLTKEHHEHSSVSDRVGGDSNNNIVRTETNIIAKKEIGVMTGKRILEGTGMKIAIGAGAAVVTAGVITGVIIHNHQSVKDPADTTELIAYDQNQPVSEEVQAVVDDNPDADITIENLGATASEETISEDAENTKSYDETLIGYVADGGAYINDYFGITIDLDDSVWEVNDYETVRAEYSMSDKPITERLLNNDLLTILSASHRSLDMQEDGVTPRQDMGWIIITVQDKSASEYGDPRFREEDIPEEVKEEHFRSQVETVASTSWFSEKEDVMYVGTIQVGSMSGYYYVHEYVEYDGEPTIEEDIYLYDGPLWVRITIGPWNYQAENMEEMYTRLEAIEAHFNSIQKTETEIITERMEKE